MERRIELVVGVGESVDGVEERPVYIVLVNLRLDWDGSGGSGGRQGEILGGKGRDRDGSKSEAGGADPCTVMAFSRTDHQNINKLNLIHT